MPQLAQHGHQRPQLFVVGDSLLAYANRVGVDLDQIGAFLLHRQGAVERGVGVGALFAAVEVEHAHDQGPHAQGDVLVLDEPVVAPTHRCHALNSVRWTA